jgi:hypothetical protein
MTRVGKGKGKGKGGIECETNEKLFVKKASTQLIQTSTQTGRHADKTESLCKLAYLGPAIRIE